MDELLYRKYSVDVRTGSLIRGDICHTKADLLTLIEQETAQGHTVTVREVWLHDQGAGPVEGEGRKE